MRTKESITRRPVYRLLSSILRGQRGRYAVFLLGSAACGAAVLLPLHLAQVFTEWLGVLSRESFSGFLVEVGLLGVLVAAALAVSGFGSVWLEEWMRLRLETRLQLEVLDRLHRLPATALDPASRGEWITRISRDIASVEDWLGRVIPELVQNGAIAAGALVLFARETGPFAAIPLVVAGILALVAARVQRRLSPIYARMRRLQGALVQQLVENVEGWRTIRSAEVVDFELARLERRGGDFIRRGMSSARWVGLGVGLTQLVTQLFLTLCLVSLGLGIARGRLTAASVLVYPFYLGQFLFAVRGLVGAMHSWARFRSEGARLASWLEGAPRESVPAPLVVAARGRRRLVLRELAIGYPGFAPLVRGLDLELKQGELRALVGESGCGKSTLLEVLAGLRRPLAGQAHLDGERIACAVGEWLPHSLCAYVEQKPFLFAGSLRENLCLGRDGIATGRVREVLASVRLDSWVDARGGLEMRIRDRGTNVSEGQRYRLGIARALLLDRPFLLLDEPFAALDAESAQAVAETLGELKRVLGILVVAHHAPGALVWDAVDRIGEEVARRPIPSRHLESAH